MENQNIHADPFDEIREAVNEHYGEIIRRAYGVKEGTPIFLDSYGQSKIRGGNGKTTVAKCDGVYRLGSESAEPSRPMEIYIKVYRGMNGDGKKRIDYMQRPREPWKYEAEAYRLFGQSGIVPKAFLFEDIPGLEDKLLTLSAGNQTLEQRIAELNSSNQGLSDSELAVVQLPLFLNVASTQAMFDNYAEENVIPQLIEKDRKAPLNFTSSMEMNAVEKSLNYLRAWLDKDEIGQIPPEITALFIEYYQPIISRLEKNRKRLIHGALDGDNIVSMQGGGWKAPDLRTGEPGDIKFIDLESLRFGHSFFDLASVATTPGSYLGPKQWEEMIDYYNESRLRLFGLEPEERNSYSIARFLSHDRRGESELKINENAFKGMRSVFYTGVIHNAFKIGAKLKDREKFFPESFAAMIQENPCLIDIHKHNNELVVLGIDHILKHHEDFVIEGPNYNRDAFTIEDVKTLRSLLLFLIAERIIPSDDGCPIYLMEKYQIRKGSEGKTA